MKIRKLSLRPEDAISKKRVHVVLTPELHWLARVQAARLGVTFSALLSRALADYLRQLQPLEDHSDSGRES